MAARGVVAGRDDRVSGEGHGGGAHILGDALDLAGGYADHEGF